MFRRTTLCVLALAILAFGATQMPTVGAATTTRLNTHRAKGFRVEFRAPGTSRWLLAGTYTDRSKAQSTAAHVYREGNEVRFTAVESVTLLRPSTTPTPTPSTRPSLTASGMPRLKPVNVPTSLSVVSASEAMALFNQMRGQSYIAFRYPSDGCYARAHLMCQQMQAKGLKPGKAWVFDDSKQNRLFAATRAHPRGYVQWWYHVAPIVKIRLASGKVRTHVIDPSLFDRPVSIFEWQKRMYNPRLRFLGRLECTALNQAPHDGSGRRFEGSGYWPGKDPSNATTHARIVMARYKPHEGTAWTPPRVASRSTTAVARGTPEVTTPFNPHAPTPAIFGQ